MAGTEAARPWWIRPVIIGLAVGAVLTNPVGSADRASWAIDGVYTFAGRLLGTDATTTEPGNSIPSPGDVLQ